MNHYVHFHKGASCVGFIGPFKSAKLAQEQARVLAADKGSGVTMEVTPYRPHEHGCQGVGMPKSVSRKRNPTRGAVYVHADGETATIGEEGGTTYIQFGYSGRGPFSTQRVKSVAAAKAQLRADGFRVKRAKKNPLGGGSAPTGTGCRDGRGGFVPTAWCAQQSATPTDRTWIGGKVFQRHDPAAGETTAALAKRLKAAGYTVKLVQFPLGVGVYTRGRAKSAELRSIPATYFKDLDRENQTPKQVAARKRAAAANRAKNIKKGYKRKAKK